jgi:peptidoglycan/LPS O-acetylase OafA/YrhL
MTSSANKYLVTSLDRSTSSAYSTAQSLVDVKPTSHDYLSALKQYAAFQNTRVFSSLDGLRAFSILAVIWHHGPGFNSHHLLLRQGQLGVRLFFAISGFLITTLLLREHRATGQICLKNFYARRSLRIFPLYYTVLGLYCVVAALQHDPRTQQFFHDLPYFLTYTSNWFVLPAARFSLAWSLATEEQFYSTWPWVEKFLNTKRAIWIMIIALVAHQIAFISHVAASRPFWGAFLGAFAPSICFGVLIAHGLDSERSFNRLYRVLGRRYASLALAAGALAFMAVHAPRVLTEAVFAALVGACVIREDHALSRLLRHRYLSVLGMVSYGMYLFHGFVFVALSMFIRPTSLLAFCVATIVTFAIAFCSYGFYESYFLRMKRRFSTASTRAAI